MRNVKANDLHDEEVFTEADMYYMRTIMEE